VVERFPVERIPVEVRGIAQRLKAAGHDAWFVGGAVRDALLEIILHRSAPRAADYDIATSALPDEVRTLFRRTVPIGIAHGTVAVLDERGASHEVTTFRKDVRTDGRHAEVEFGVSLEEDLARRDYTINAVAVHPDSGELRDPFAGRSDIEARLVRAVGDPAQRMREDRLRVLRALRFAATLGFTIDPATWEAVKDAAADLAHLSRERVRDEWLKMVGISASRGVSLWREAGVLEEVWPELAALDAAADAALDGVTGRDPVLVTAAALAAAGASAESAGEAARRLRLSNQDVDRVRRAVAGVGAPLPAHGDRRAVRKWMSAQGAAVDDVLGVMPEVERRPLTATVLAIRRAKEPLAVSDLAVSGDDLLEAGVKPGPAVGEALRRLLDLVLEDPERNTREDLLAAAVERR
jgi:tRNA nucleotidyltransferase (CCA-adding enzyme)